MTLQDLMDLLWAGHQQQTLLRQTIERSLLLAYEMGVEQGRHEGDTATRRRGDTGRERDAAPQEERR